MSVSNSFDLRLSINQLSRLIDVNGDVKSYIIEGPMGSGKSSLINMARERHGDKYHYCVVDCTQWDVGDVQLPDVDKVKLVVRFLPNVLLVGEGDKPVYVLLDEFGKASRPVQNALLPVILERRVGAVAMPERSVVFAATNLGAEGVGDLFQPHARNRVSFVEMRHPNAEEWIQWGIDNGVAPAILAWANENPQIFHSFKDYDKPDSNPYIFHPKQQARSFCTPRSLYLASVELQETRRAKVGDENVTFAAIAGNIGVRAAADLMAFVHLADKLPAWDTIVNAPEHATVPEGSPAAMCLTVYSCVAKVDKANFDNVLAYMQRLPKEIQCMYATQLMRSNKNTWVALKGNFTKWIMANSWVLQA
jgi:hypothetical protein